MALSATLVPGGAPAKGAARGIAAPGASKGETRWLLWPPLAFFVIALVAPMVFLFRRAFTTDSGSTFLEALALPQFGAAVGRTVLLAAVVTVLTVVLGYFYAMAVAVSPTWFKAVLTAGLLLSLWTSVMVRTFGWMLLELPKGAIYWFLQQLGFPDVPVELYQTTIGMYPAMVAVMLPFAVLPMLSAINGLDREQLNAATVFGAGPVLTFRKVILPAITPSLISAAVLVFVMSLGFYVTPLLLGGPTNQTVSGVINGQMTSANRPDLAAAMSILLVAGTVIIYLIADRIFRVSEKWG